jgi:uncharacterized protein YcfL
MKLIALFLVVLVGCSSTPPAPSKPAPVVIHEQTYPNQKLVVDSEVSEMSRQDIISAIHECQENDLRPIPVKSKKRVEGRITDAIINVICGPQKQK